MYSTTLYAVTQRSYTTCHFPLHVQIKLLYNIAKLSENNVLVADIYEYIFISEINTLGMYMYMYTYTCIVMFSPCKYIIERKRNVAVQTRKFVSKTNSVDGTAQPLF